MSQVSWMLTWQNLDPTKTLGHSPGGPTLQLVIPGGYLLGTNHTVDLLAGARYVQSGAWVYLANTGGSATAPNGEILFNWQHTITLASQVPGGSGTAQVAITTVCLDSGGGLASTYTATVAIDIAGGLGNWLDVLGSVKLDSEPWLDVSSGAYCHLAPGVTTSLPTQSVTLLPPFGVQTIPETIYDHRQILFPFEGNLATAQDGTQWVARRRFGGTGDEYPLVGIYRRDAYNCDPWQRVGDPTGAVGLVPIVELAHARFYSPIPVLSPDYLAAYTDDRGATWGGTDTSHLDLIGVLDDDGALAVQTDVCFSPIDRLCAHVGVEWRDGADQVWVAVTCSNSETAAVFGPTQVTANSRAAGDTGCLPRPSVWRNADGTWSIGLLNGGGHYLEWRCDEIDGLAWSLAYDQDLGTWANLDAAIFAQGRDGRQLCVGYNAAAQLATLHRSGPEGTWAQGAPIGTQAIYPPYLFERPDGILEVGWMDPATEVFTTYTSADPAVSWEFFS